MNTHEAWELALKQTDVIRSRISALQTYKDTAVPYMFLSPSQINAGDTVIRRGEVVVQKPSLILPPNVPQIKGFDLSKEEGMGDSSLFNFLLVRGISIPSLHYNNKTYSLDIFEGNVNQAISHYANQLEREEDVRTGLLAGVEDVWQFSVLIFICSQIARNTQMDLKRLMEEYRQGPKGYLN